MDWPYRTLGKVLAAILPRGTTLRRLVVGRLRRRLEDDAVYRTFAENVCSQMLNFDAGSRVLFLGSSHIATNVLPAVSETLRGWNAAVHGGDFRTAYFVYDFLRKRWPKADGQSVVLCEDFWDNANRLEESPNYYFTVILHLLIGLPYARPFGMRRTEQRIAPLVGNCRNSGSYRALATLRGAVPETKPAPISASAVAERVGKHLQLASKPSTECIWAERLIEMIREDGRRPVWLRPPLREDYRRALDSGTDRASLWKPFEMLEAGVPCLDYTEMAFAADEWMDCDHLLVRGAERLSRRIARDLEAPDRSIGPCLH